MKSIKKILVLLLGVCMMGLAISMSVFAGTPDDFTMEVDKTEVNVGDTVTVTISNVETELTAMTLVMKFDNTILQCTGLTNVDGDDGDDDLFMYYLNSKGKEKPAYPDAGYCTVDDINDNSQFQFLILGTEDSTYVEGDVVVFTFKAIKEGTVDISLKTTVVDANGEISKTVTKTLTITDVPTCDHATTKLVPNNDGTHNVVCAADGCGHVVTEIVTCTGTDDNDCTTAVICECGNVVTEAAEHTPEADDGDCTTAVKCVNCEKNAVDANTHVDGDDNNHACDNAGCTVDNVDGGCHGGEATCTAQAVCTECGNMYGNLAEHSFTTKASSQQKTPADCTNAATYYVQCDKCDAVSTTETVSVGEAKGHGQTLGFCYTSDGVDTNTHTQYCNDCKQAIEGKTNVTCSDNNKDHKCDDCTTTICAHDHYDITATTHQSICSCGKAIGEAEAHDYENAEHKCVCGKVQTFTVIFNFNGGVMDPDMKDDIEKAGYDLTDTSVIMYVSYGFNCDVYLSGLTRDGYTLSGFIDGDGKTYNVSDHCTITGNMEFTAQWELHVCEHHRYDTTDTTHQSVCKCGKTIGEVEVHDQNIVYFLGTCNAPAIYGCSACKVSQTGDKNFDIHNGNIAYKDLTETSHTACYSCCGKVIEENVPHKQENVQSSFAGNCTQKSSTTYLCPCGKSHTVTGDVNPDVHSVNTVAYSITATCHTAYYPCCYETIETVEHDYKYNADAHKCICGYVEKIILRVHINQNIADKCGIESIIEFSVPYGTKLLEFLTEQEKDGNLPKMGTKYRVQNDEYNGEYEITGYSRTMGVHQYVKIDGDYVMSEYSLSILQDAAFTGWYRFSDDLIQYQKDGEELSVGWHYIEEDYDDVEGGAWYYFYKYNFATYRAEGLTRVPYPTEAINGITYAPNQEDLDYAANKGIEFIDSTEAWFAFDENGKFLYTKTGIENGKYIENGMIAWHPGFVKVDNVWYYFVGDGEIGGNKLANGEIYVTRNAEAAGYKSGDLINFVDGRVKMDINGIIDGYYYVNGQKISGAGLVKVDGDIYYIRSNGKVATGTYYITKTNGMDGFTAGQKLIFGEDGKLQAIKNGIVEEGGKLYYYENNKLKCGAGVVELTDENGDIFYIYVRSNGQLATGKYWPTTRNGYLERGEYDWGTDGKYYPVEEKNGIVEAEEEGTTVYYYYEDDKIAYGKGVVEMTDENGDIFYIYVRSNGQLATGKYWPTTRNGYLERGEYDWGTDGKYYPAN